MNISINKLISKNKNLVILIFIFQFPSQYDFSQYAGGVHGSDTPPRSPMGRSPMGRSPMCQSPMGRSPMCQSPMGRSPIPQKEISTVSISVTYTDGETSVMQFLTSGQPGISPLWVPKYLFSKKTVLGSIS